MKRFIMLASCAFIAGCSAPKNQMPPAKAAILTPGDGADLAIGGIGIKEGQFARLRDLTFGLDGRLYTLETAGREKSAGGDLTGLGRVQVFDDKGNFVSAFSLGDDAQIARAVTDKNEDGPMSAARLAVDGRNRVYVSFPQAGLVRVFEPSGTKVGDIALPHALALARTHEGKVVAVASRALIQNNWIWAGGEAMMILNGAAIERTIPLAQKLDNVQDVAVAPGGDVLVLGATGSPKYIWDAQALIYRFSPTGQVVSSIGSGILTRQEDGSEPKHSLVVSKNGDITTLTWGNPGKTIRYFADGKTIARNYGEFAWADSWSGHGAYNALALDPNDRLWVAVTSVNDPTGPNFARQHDRPVVLRTNANFFDPKTKNVLISDARALGFAPRLESSLPDNIAFEPGKPIETSVVVAPAKRNLKAVSVAFRVFDSAGQVVGQGEKPLALPDGAEARLPLSFTPPRFGSYSLVTSFKIGADVLSSQAIHFGVTPRFANLPDGAGGGKSDSWEDAPRQAFTGLKLMRLHPDKGGDKWREKLGGDLNSAKEAGVLPLIQLTDKKERFTPARAREVMEFAKGRVRYVELFNEPNFSFSPQEFFERAKPVIAAIRAVDPTVQIMGPSTVEISLPWIEEFYKSGVAKTVDIIAVHDYEGHESISPEHWTWKLGELRRIMAQNGDAGKPVWQTERAISSVRGGLLTGQSQAIRVTLHRDVLSSLGVPDDHNSHYYLNQGGYSDVPSYVWSSQGPLPAALATRTRAGLLAGRPFVGKVDFGATGNTLFLGARYRDASGETLSLRNLVGAPMKVDFASPANVEVFDAFGNALPAPVRGGVLSLEVGQLPTYVQLKGAGTLAPRAWNWGANLGLNARVSVEGKSANPLENLSNGKLETIHAGNPLGGTDGKQIVHLSEFSPDKPARVSLDLAAPVRFNRVIVRGLRADNQFSSLRDFDVQARVGGAWKTVGTSKADIPPTIPGQSADALAMTFYGDDNAWVVSFAAVQSDGVRLVIRDATRGFAPDDFARAQVQKTWGGANAIAASLREIEVYNAP